MAESYRIALAVSDILSETGTVIHAMPFPAGSYLDRTMLMHEIRREGHDLTSESQRSLDKADQCLTTARAEFAIKLSSEAGPPCVSCRLPCRPSAHL